MILLFLLTTATLSTPIRSLNIIVPDQVMTAKKYFQLITASADNKGPKGLNFISEVPHL